MNYPVFYPVAGSTLRIPFSSYDSNGASVTLTGLAVTDIEIYKDGSVTQRASDAGFTLLDTDGIDFDGITGIHGFSIDLSDNTDSGFYAVGSQYWIVVSAVTIDGQTVSFIAAWFEIVSATRRLAGTSLSTANENAEALLALADGVEANLTVREFMRLAAAVLYGEATGMAGSAVFRDTNDTVDRVTATITDDDRASVVLDPDDAP
jgi:hypothetical protein